MNASAVMYGAIAGMITSLFFAVTIPGSELGGSIGFGLCLSIWFIAAGFDRRD